MVLKSGWAGGLDQSNPLSVDIALFDMYMTAVNAVLSRPEIVIAIDEFELSAPRLRAEMMTGAGPVLRSALPEFAAYEEAFAREAEVNGDPGLITYGWRLGVTRLARLQVRNACVGGAVLLLAGVASVWFWRPAVALIGAGATLLAVAGVLVGCWRALTTEYGRMLLERTARSADGIELVLARNRLMTAVSQTEVLEQVRAHINDARQDRFDDKYQVSTSPGLSEVYDILNRVPTQTARELDELLIQLEGASVGVAGPRGSGKSMLIRQYCEDSGALEEGLGGTNAEWLGDVEPAWDRLGDLRCMVAAPVDYAARDFVLHLFATFCQAVIRSYARKPRWRDGETPYLSWLKLAGSLLSSLLWRAIVFGGAAAALLHWQDWIARQLSIQPTWVQYAGIAVICLGAADFVRSAVRQVRHWARASAQDELVTTAKKQLAKVRYLQTHTSSLSGGLNLPGGAKGQLTRGISRAEQPLSHPEIVDEFRSFARTVAAYAHQRGSRIFIGVDELDKIGSPEQVEHFLNEIKGIFGIPHVYFIVSVSDDALTAFERRGLPLRDAFDSSFDEIIHVGPLRYLESRRLLYRRVVGLSEPYVALCHCLAGGLARDLIRAARNIVRTAAELGGSPVLIGEGYDSDDPVEYVIAQERPAPHFLTISTISEAVVHDELRNKALAISHVVSGVGSLGTTEFQALLYDTASRLTPGKPILTLIDLLAKPSPAESAAVAGLRLEFAAYAYYCATLQDTFNDQLDNKRIIDATSQPIGPGSFDTLADARNAFTRNTMLAWRLITEFRAAWSMETREPPQSLPRGGDSLDDQPQRDSTSPTLNPS